MEQITYTEKDGILYPNLMVSENYMPLTRMGKYGRMALYYLEQTRPHRAMELRLNGELMEAFHRVDEEATEKMISLEDELLQSNPIPDPNEYLATVQHRNMIRAQAEEIVLREIVYQPR